MPYIIDIFLSNKINIIVYHPGINVISMQVVILDKFWFFPVRNVINISMGYWRVCRIRNYIILWDNIRLLIIISKNNQPVLIHKYISWIAAYFCI